MNLKDGNMNVQVTLHKNKPIELWKSTVKGRTKDDPQNGDGIDWKKEVIRGSYFMQKL